MSDIIRYWILYRADLDWIKDLESITEELREIAKDIDKIGNFRESVADSILDFLDFVDNTERDYFTIQCWDLTSFRKSWQISHGKNSQRNLRKTLTQERDKFKKNGKIVQEISSEELHEIVTSLWEDPNYLISEVTPYLLVIDCIRVDTLTAFLKACQKAANISHITFEILLEICCDYEEITFVNILPVLEKFNQITADEFDLILEIAHRDTNCSFEQIYSQATKASSMYNKNLSLLCKIAIEDKNCWDSSEKLLWLAKKHDIELSRKMRNRIKDLQNRSK